MTVVGFDPVTAVAAGPFTAPPGYVAFRPKLSNRRRVGSQTIPGEYVRRLVVGVGQRLLQEQLGGHSVPRVGEVKVDGLPVPINRAEQVHPFAGNSYESLIHVPRGRFPLHLAMQSFVDLWAIGLSPSPDRRMIDGKSPLRHELSAPVGPPGRCVPGER